MNEADVSRKIRLMLEELGAVCWKVSDRFHASRPDLVACHLGRYFAIESKIYPNKATAAQEHELNKIVQAGGAAYVATYNKVSKDLSILDKRTGEPAYFKDIRGAAQWVLRHRT